MSNTITISKEKLAKTFSIQAAAIIALLHKTAPTKESLDKLFEQHMKDSFLEEVIEGMATDFDGFEKKEAAYNEAAELLKTAFSEVKEKLQEIKGRLKKEEDV